MYLGKKTTTPVPDTEHSMFNLHPGASFVELPKLIIEFRSAGM